MTKARNAPAVVTKLSINGLGVARALGRSGVRVIGICDGSPLPGCDSRYVSEIWEYHGKDADLAEFLLREHADLPERPVLFPITDESVLSLDASGEQLRQSFRIGMPAPGVAAKAMSKRGFADLATDLALPAPRTLFLQGEEEIHRAADSMSYPCILKPEFRTPEFIEIAQQKALRIEDRDSLVASYLSFCHVAPRAIVQEWIPGGDGDVYFCLQYYGEAGRPLVSFCGRKIRQWPPLCGGTASCEPVESPELEESTTSFFSRLSFRGLCSMEFKRNPDDGKYLMVEPTVGRTDWQSAVADINGVPIPYVAYCDLVGLDPPAIRPARRRIKWVRWSADKRSAEHYRGKGKLSFLRWLWSIRPPLRWAVWSTSDPAPYLASLWRRVLRKLRKIRARLLARGAPAKERG